ncbi:DUF397 domain-containing protein [Streptomyces sp. 3213.3]|nr:DUF397 domain-containing protein [Streptomyces sp. 3213.3]
MEVAHRHPDIVIRDSKVPARAILVFPAPAFTAFVDGLVKEL